MPGRYLLVQRLLIINKFHTVLQGSIFEFEQINGGWVEFKYSSRKRTYDNKKSGQT